jgi:uncharacterized protein YndB with AHSA1/START domain
MSFSIFLLIALVGFIAFVATRPDEFRVARSTVIAAAPEKIFLRVNTLRLWQDWSPWAKLDPDAKTTFEGPESGVGAVMRWDGNNKVGQGSMTIIESRPNESIKFRLDFLKPMQATSAAEFTFKAEGGQTTVTWSMSGENNFVRKAMSVIMNCDKMIGGQFEKGLASLRDVARS